MRRPLFAPLALLTAAAFAGPAHADGGSPPRPGDAAARWLADGDVRALASVTVDGLLTRAVVSDHDGVPALVIETFDRAARRDRPTTQFLVDTFRLDDRVLAFEEVASAIDNLQLTRRALTFEAVVRGSDEPLRCALDLGLTRATCRGPANGEHPVRPERPPRGGYIANWAADPTVIQTCADAFYAAESETACLERVRAFRFDPTPVIRACDTHAYGDVGALACLANVAGSLVDPTDTIAACDAATYGQEFFLQCLGQAQAFRFGPAATIDACDHAMYGDAATVACIAATSRFSADATPTIAACDAAMYGDDAVLACIQRGGAY
ncbi:MAG: hypothetical protein U1F43_12110 [Myxococcota bacterium]